MDRLLQPVVGDNGQEKFCVEMMKRLKIQRRNEHLCDVILNVGSGDHQARLKAHKIVLCAASPFFYNALNTDMTEKKEGVIKLEQTNKAVMEDVLEYLYTGHVDINEHNVFDLLQSADFLIVPSLKLASVEFISETLSSSNCLMAYYSASRYQCPDLQRQAKDFIFANFMSVTESADFQNLEGEEVEEWISSDEIQINGEEDVFQVILKWMEGRDHKEGEVFFELFRHVRVVYMSRNFVFKVVFSHPLVKDSAICTEFVLNALKEVSSGSEDCYFAKPPRKCLNNCEDGLVICKGNKTYCYIPSINRWYKMADMVPGENMAGNRMVACHGKVYMMRKKDGIKCALERYDPSVNSWAPVISLPSLMQNSTHLCWGVVNFQGCLYFFGGASDCIHKYNPDTKLWQEVPPMSVARWGVCAVADESSLYAIGGMSGDGVLDLVEKYDPERNSWNRVASTAERKMLSCGAIVKEKVFLFGGFLGGNGNEPQLSSCIEMYDPTSNVWSILQNTDVLGFTSAVSFKEGIYLVRHERYNISLYKYDFDKKELLSCAEYHNACDTDSNQWLTLTSLRIPKDSLQSFVQLNKV